MTINGQRTSSTQKPNPQSKGGKTKNGGGVHFGGPTLNINANRTTTTGGQGGGSAGGSGGRNSWLPDPDFRSAAELREYCNALRAFAVHASIEVHVGAEILQAALGQASGLPGDNVIQHKLRARKVARKLKKAADALADVASLSAATWAAFQREYADVITARPGPNQRGGQSRPFSY
ncbi:plasmid transfer protein TraA [Streptomyces sp. NBC_01565]|uniref:plasmid transfer protein TraA n=1 Tax=Streptomyces sp. NBC_01565 TaxID=2975881 RepID=UPI002259374E|nr:plasmid transfer protein TraA [Streptomyces sp. NBC_01565]MCX4547199.1 plasmid transfer protein TraA [Streptomyces sp. NBC_01565]MCX4547213.1 plasmid transfer protein TraA [Streptomyces sp. NBC_01565]